MCSLICRAKYYSSGIQGPCLPGRATPPAFLKVKEPETEENNAGYRQSCSGCDQAEAHELTRGQTHAHAHARTKALRHVQAMSPFIPHATLSLAVSCDQSSKHTCSDQQKRNFCIIHIAICNNSSSQATVSKTFN